jgi:uncharacterized protein
MNRIYWKQLLTYKLQRRSLVWLSGVRRVGKTTLCRSLEGAHYFDCELPSVRLALNDVETFLQQFVDGSILVFDEVHRLVNPSEILKIATDHFPNLKIVATGSSTLAARKKFKDTLAGRKEQLWLVPCLLEESKLLLEEKVKASVSWDFCFRKRAILGGLPGFMLQDTVLQSDYLEWIESYWAKDVQELFTVGRRASFELFMQLLLQQSGELFEATSFAAPCSVSRQTIQNYLNVLETTLIFNSIPPYFSGKASELRSQKKVYAFDTGILSWSRKWNDLSPENRGTLLEHLALNELLATISKPKIHYWRSKSKLEVDFVVTKDFGTQTIAIECKANSNKFQSKGLESFRTSSPDGLNILVSFDIRVRSTRMVGGLRVECVPLWELGKFVKECAE